jgi:signal transduction histidine kinase
MSAFSKAIAALALIILVCIGVLSYSGEIQSEHDRQWVTHTLFVVEKLQDIRIDITQAETGQRGYLLTGQERYLELYLAGINKMSQDGTELANLTADNRTERDAIQRLYPLIGARLIELGQGIEVRRNSGLLAGVEVVAHGTKGEKLMEQIAALIGEMRRTEAQLLSGRLETAAGSTRRLKLVIAYGNALAILILLVKGIVIHREIGRRNEAEQNLNHAVERLEQRTAELSDTNKELESFAYSVAHDLRAPLRHIAGYSNVIAQDYGPLLDAEGMRYLGKIANGAQQMGRLVDDLLGLSQIGRQELSLQVTSLDSLLKEVMDDLASDYAGRKVEWHVGELFSVPCDAGLMKQVFTNLLSNALKYTSKREQAVIRIGQVTRNGERVIFVQDNGVGFEMQYVDKLFGVFQRLHKARDFPGTGVGLAIVQRIIRKHAGRIWAEAELNAGAAFYFTLGEQVVIPNKPFELPIVEDELYVARS